MNSRNKAILSLGAVFLFGILVGILIDSNLLHHDRKRSKGRGHPDLLEVFTRELELSSQQQDKLKELLENFKTKFHAVGAESESQFGKVREEFNDQFKQILDETQKEKFKKMIEEFEKKVRRK